MENEMSLISALEQFRLDVIEALAALDTEIDSLQQALEEGKVVPSERLKELRAKSRMRIERFRNFHSERIGRI
jgi:hypothetical protein